VLVVIVVVERERERLQRLLRMKRE
jgi:hypothetical protein